MATYTTTPAVPSTITGRLTAQVNPTGHLQQVDRRDTAPMKLTEDESALVGRATAFITAALRRQGISPNGQEAKWLGAEVADFVILESEGVAAAPVAAAPKTPAAAAPVHSYTTAPKK